MSAVLQLVKMDLLKLLSLKKIMLLVLGLVVVLGVTMGDFIAIIPILLLYCTSFLVVAYDDASKGNYLYGSLPVTRTQIILSKYLNSLFVLVLSILLLYGVSLAGSAFGATLIAPELLLGSLIAGVLFISVMLPFVLVLGANKSRIIVLILYMISFSAVTSLQDVLSIHAGAFLNALSAVPTFVWVLLPFLLLVASFFISRAFYVKREFTD